VIEIRRAADRAVSRGPGVETWHSFSSGAHYDGTNTHFGLLVAHDEHHVQPGSGFDMHPHRALEIVTWVLSGALFHEDSTGRRNTVRHGMVQHLSAGSGVQHVEWNDAAEELRFVQMWLLGDPGMAPAYRAEERAILRLERANLHVVLPNDDTVVLPQAPYVHVFVTRGSCELDGAVRLAAGDAARLRPGDGHAVTGNAELLIWEMRADATD
jgi:redox-sensitive bicupin YhaK (pirin superfamily)